MMKKRKVTVVLLAIALIAFIVEVRAVDYRPYQFEKGSWIKYKLSANSNATETPLLVKEANEIEWLMFIIESIHESSITLLKKITFKNETQIQRTYKVDVSTGSGIEIPVIIASNLEVGNPIFISDQAPKIGRTIKLEFLGKNRKVNVASHTEYFDIFGDNGAITQFYWDKETGVLCICEILIWETIKGGIKVITQWRMELIEKSDNIWNDGGNGESFGTALVFTIIIILFIIVIIFIRRIK